MAAASANEAFFQRRTKKFQHAAEKVARKNSISDLRRQVCRASLPERSSQEPQPQSGLHVA